MKSFEESFVIEQDTDNNTIEITKNDLNPRNLEVIHFDVFILSNIVLLLLN